MREQLASALRELEAARMRVERDARSVADETRKQLVEQLLPVLDNLDRTIGAAESGGEAPSIVEGARLVRTQLEGVLRGFGLARFDAVDEDFDPAIHDAVATAPVPQLERARVLDQVTPGYRFERALLRPARVVVGLPR